MHYFVILLQREINDFRQQTAFYSLEYDLPLNMIPRLSKSVQSITSNLN